MASLLDTAIASDGSVREAPYVLLCMVAAIEKVTESPSTQPVTIRAIYQQEQTVHPLERLMEAASDFSLLKKANKKAKTDDEQEGILTLTSMALTRLINELADLKRLTHSTMKQEIKHLLRRQINTLQVIRTREQIGVSLPRHLKVESIEEDPLEFRRDCHGVAIASGRNVLGEHYAPFSRPLSFLQRHSAPEIFQRMKRVVREDLSTRNKRRIAALNEKERQHKKELEMQGILSPEQQLEAKLDRLFKANAAAS